MPLTAVIIYFKPDLCELPGLNTMLLRIQLSFPITSTLRPDPHQNHPHSNYTGDTLNFKAHAL